MHKTSSLFVHICASFAELLSDGKIANARKQLDLHQKYGYATVDRSRISSMLWGIRQSSLQWVSVCLQA